MGHGHDHGPASPASQQVRRVLVAVLAPLALALVVAMVVLWPTAHHPAATGLGFDQQTAQGTVTATQTVPCADGGSTGSTGTNASTSGSSTSGSGTGASGTGGATPTDSSCTALTIRLTSGPGAGGFVRQVVGDDPATPRYSAGDGVVLAYQPGAPPGQEYTITDFTRGPPMLLLAALFAVVVAAVGRWRGVAALTALGVSFALLVLFVLPGILDGENALAVAVVGAGVIMLAVLYLTHGLSARTSIAVIGTLASLGLIAALGSIFAAVAKLTGLASEEVALIAGQYPGIDVRGLLVAGYVIGSLGVLDDVTVTQTSAVWELRQANPALTSAALYRAGMRIGRDHIASTVNTLVMAYAGAALPLLLLFSVAGHGPGTVVTTDLVAEDVVRALVGGIGLVASVPLTTWLAALVAVRQQPGTSVVHTRDHHVPTQSGGHPGVAAVGTPRATRRVAEAHGPHGPRTAPSAPPEPSPGRTSAPGAPPHAARPPSGQVPPQPGRGRHRHRG